MKNKVSMKSMKKQMFSSPAACLHTLMNYRTSKGDKCLNPECDGIIEKDYFKMNTKRAFYCRQCFQKFFPCVDSLFHGMHIDIEEAFEIIFLLLSLSLFLGRTLPGRPRSNSSHRHAQLNGQT